MLTFSQAILAITATLRFWPGWGFGGRQAYGVIRDWAYTARHGRFPLLGGVDAESAVGGVGTPVLAISVDGDRYTPAPTVDQLCGKLTSAPVSRRHLAAADAGQSLDHFRWVRTAAIASWVARFAWDRP